MSIATSPVARRASSAGFTLVELMVALAIGLVVMASAGVAMADLVRSATRTLVVTRVDQDLRIATDLMAGELRRAGFWQDAHRALAPAATTVSGLAVTASPGLATGSVSAPSASTGGSRPRNPYQSISVGPAGELLYSQSRDAENDLVDGNESFGFRLHGSTLEYLLGGSGWQAVTDASVVAITRFVIAPSTSVQWFADACAAPCSTGTSTATLPACPSTTLRRIDLVVQAHAVIDPSVVREVTLTVRTRNDALEGSC